MRNLFYLVLFCALYIAVSEAGGKGKGKGGKGGMMKMFMQKFKKCGDGEINIEEVMKGKKECWKGELPEEKESRRRRSPEDERDDESEGKQAGGKGKGKGGMFGGMFAKYQNKLCPAVCQWKKLGLLDDSGSYSESGAKEFVTKVYPEQYRANMTEQFTTCATENSSKFSMDNNCLGYMDFKKCLFKSHMSTCGISFQFTFTFGKGKKGEPAPAQPQDEDEDEE